MNPDECPECFGCPQKSGALESCKTCRYIDSCRYCAENDSNACNRRLGHVSYDRYSYSEETADKAPRPGEQEPETVTAENACVDNPLSSTGAPDVYDILRFLLDIDNYTAELLSAVLYGGAATGSELARKFGVSRQAVHRKIIDCCTEHPELRELFRIRLTRCRRLMSDSARLTKKPPKENERQMKLDFGGDTET